MILFRTCSLYVYGFGSSLRLKHCWCKQRITYDSAPLLPVVVSASSFGCQWRWKLCNKKLKIQMATTNAPHRPKYRFDGQETRSTAWPVKYPMAVPFKPTAVPETRASISHTNRKLILQRILTKKFIHAKKQPAIAIHIHWFFGETSLQSNVWYTSVKKWLCAVCSRYESRIMLWKIDRSSQNLLLRNLESDSNSTFWKVRCRPALVLQIS